MYERGRLSRQSIDASEKNYFSIKKAWKKVARLFKALSTHYCNNDIIVIGYKIKKYENFTTLEGWAWNS